MQKSLRVGAIALSLIALSLATGISRADKQGVMSYMSIKHMLTREGNIDPGRFSYAEPALLLRHGTGKVLPDGTRIVIDTAPTPLVLRPDDANVVVWPMMPALTRANPDVHSIPSDLLGTPIVRVSCPPTRLLSFATLRAMRQEYEELVAEFGWLERLRAPSAERLKIVVDPGARVVVKGANKIWLRTIADASGIAYLEFDHIPAGTGAVEISQLPHRIQIDLGME